MVYVKQLNENKNIYFPKIAYTVKWNTDYKISTTYKNGPTPKRSTIMFAHYFLHWSVQTKENMYNESMIMAIVWPLFVSKRNWESNPRE